LRPSPRSRPEVERAAEHRRLLGRGLPSRAASLAKMAWREEEESRHLSMLIVSPCPCASGGHGGELRDGEVAQGDVLKK
jgi:hypothetical protein